MARKCSHCGIDGHNSRTCSNPRCMVGGGGLRLFGVQLHKSFSMDSLSSSYITSSTSPLSSSSSSSSLVSMEHTEKIPNGYLSDGLMCKAPERKKGVPWTEGEHRLFLAGLEKLGKGDWRGISRNFVITRTPTQVASHAQKYFLRQNSFNKKRRRSSLFDVVGSCESDVPTLSLNTKAYGMSNSDNLAIDLRVTDERQDSSMCLMPNSSESTHDQYPMLNLELSISSSMSSDIKNSSPSPSSLFFERITVS